MPNDLTSSQPMNQMGSDDNNDDLDLEAIRNDFDCEDVFSMAFG